MRSLKQLVLKWRLEEQMSYSQIKQRVKVSKSTLSLWLRNYPLSAQRIRELRDVSEVRIERCRETKRRNILARFLRYKEEERVKLGEISDRDLMFAGLAIYWGEGGKTLRGQLCVSNTDPGMMKVAVAWLIRVLKVRVEQISVRLQLYFDMDVEKEQDFWARELKIPRRNFARPHMKKTSSLGLTHKGRFGHGTCEVRVYKTEMFERTMANLQLLSDYFS